VPGALPQIVPNAGVATQPSLLVDNGHALAVARFLREDPSLRLDYVSNVTGLDWLDAVIQEKRKVKQVIEGVEREIEETTELKKPGYLEVVYHLYSMELKHGPLALINSSMPSLVVVPDDELLSKNISTIEQIRARGGPVIAVTSADLPPYLADAVIRVPSGEPELDPLLLNVPLQLLAYHVAANLGRDIDKPRNLAKSVTVE